MRSFSSEAIRHYCHHTAAAGSLRQGHAALPQADPLTPPAGGRPRQAMAKTKEKAIMSSLLALAIVAPLHGALAADQRANLTPGLYQAGPNGCAHATSAGTMTFDGSNFSGNHQFCKTTPLKKQFAYELECMDLMGDKTPADFDTDPDKETFELTIRVVNSRSFSVNGQVYQYCEGLK